MNGRLSEKRILARFMAVALAVAMTMAFTFVPSYVARADDSDFTITDAGVLTGYSGGGGSVSVPSSVKSIASGAFSNSSITSISIPSSVTDISQGAFSGCTSLTSISASGGSYWSSDGCLYQGSSLYVVPQGKTSVSIASGSISSGAFSGCTHIVSLNIPSSMTSIASGAFSGSSMDSVTIPNSVTSIGGQSGWNVGIIYGYTDSAAQRYANSNNIPFQSIGGSSSSGSSSSKDDDDDDEDEDETIDIVVEDDDDESTAGLPTRDDDNGSSSASSGGSSGGSSSGGSSGGSYSGGSSSGSYSGPVSYGVNTDEESSVGIDDSIETKVIKIEDGQEPYTRDEMKQIVNTNEDYNISFETEDGIKIKFAAGSMSMVKGISEYDFWVRLIMKYNRRTVDADEMTANNFSFELVFNYQGELPATAYIYVPVGKSHEGETLYYYECDDGELENISYGTVDSDGYLVVVQSHCSNYVGLNEGIHVLDGTPHTGIADDFRIFLIIAVALVGAYFIVVRGRSKFAKRR